MKMRVGLRIWLTILAGIWALLVQGLGADGVRVSAQTVLSSPASIQDEQPETGTLVREINDPHNGDHWFLIRDSSRPGGPGRMVLAGATSEQARRQGANVASPAASRQLNVPRPIPVIHSGDRVIIEEDTVRVDVRLQAVALGPAVNGSPLNVRLTIGGNVVRAVALGPGRVAFAPETAARP
jgi:hypothetical protein